jgi:hypothetical protein
MSKQTSAKPGKSTNDSVRLAAIPGHRAKDRQSVIMQALYGLIVRQGASSLSFSDIAREAGMTASHLHYYYAVRANRQAGGIVIVFFRYSTGSWNDRQPPALLLCRQGRIAG